MSNIVDRNGRPLRVGHIVRLREDWILTHYQIIHIAGRVLSLVKYPDGCMSFSRYGNEVRKLGIEELI